MSIKKTVALILFCLFINCSYTVSYAEGIGGKEVTSLQNNVSTENLSGINLFIANLYNSSKILYAVFVTTVMAVLGTLMAFGMEFILKIFGMDVSKISHAE